VTRGGRRGRKHTRVSFKNQNPLRLLRHVTVLWMRVRGKGVQGVPGRVQEIPKGLIPRRRRLLCNIWSRPCNEWVFCLCSYPGLWVSLFVSLVLPASSSFQKERDRDDEQGTCFGFLNNSHQKHSHCYLPEVIVGWVCVCVCPFSEESNNEKMRSLKGPCIAVNSLHLPFKLFPPRSKRWKLFICPFLNLIPKNENSVMSK